jgi:hypothetical protein
MSPRDDGSVTRWIGDLRAGGDSAAQHLWERYFDRLVHLARARLRSARRTDASEDDAALSGLRILGTRPCEIETRGVAVWPREAGDSAKPDPAKP